MKLWMIAELGVSFMRREDFCRQVCAGRLGSSMEYTTLGRTGLRVSVMGLGAGGHSRLGQGTGQTAETSVNIVRRALDLGINFIDTAEGYGTEALVGEGIAGRAREGIVLSTKKSMSRDGKRITPEDLCHGLEESLKRLKTDRVEVYHLHGVAAKEYDYARDQLVPAMLRLREQGKIRSIGITEAFGSDTRHEMMAPAMRDDCWDVIMVGFNVLNHSARRLVLEETRRKNIGVLDMFAVRSFLSRPEKLKACVAALLAEGRIKAKLDAEKPLDFLLSEARSIPEAAYRFCRAEPGIHVVLSGTGNVSHLEENVASILRPPLSGATRQRLIDIFKDVDHVSGQ